MIAADRDGFVVSPFALMAPRPYGLQRKDRGMLVQHEPMVTIVDAHTRRPVINTKEQTMSKITMAAAFGVGYVVGAKAGRQRYEELSGKAKELWNNPKVQEQAGKVQEQAKNRLPGGAK
ncbi:MAG: hypothetical protein WBA72_12300, partial [Ornithinimicrobium sp.]